MTHPLNEFESWIAEAQAAGEIEPHAAALATTNREGHPTVRFMLTKGLHEGKLVIVTNYESPKARDLEKNSWAEVSFYWKTLFRQARLAGPIEKAPAEFSDGYWKTRPRESQLGAWASAQSSRIESYEALEAKLAEVAKRFDGQEIPRPKNWGAYFLNPQTVELWLGQKFRIHQRALYKRSGNAWTCEYLSP